MGKRLFWKKIEEILLPDSEVTKVTNYLKMEFPNCMDSFRIIKISSLALSIAVLVCTWIP